MSAACKRIFGALNPVPCGVGVRLMTASCDCPKFFGSVGLVVRRSTRRWETGAFQSMSASEKIWSPGMRAMCSAGWLIRPRADKQQHDGAEQAEIVGRSQRMTIKSRRLPLVFAPRSAHSVSPAQALTCQDHSRLPRESIEARWAPAPGPLPRDP